MANKENKNNIITETLVDIPMPIEIEDALQMGFNKSDIVYHLIGNRKYACVLVKGTQQQRDDWLRVFDNERKAKDREARCLVADGGGGNIMCPESNKCSECKKSQSFNFDRNRPLSLEKLAVGDAYEDRTYEPAAKTDVASDAMAFATLDMLIEHLSKLNKEYGEIFKMLFEQYGVQEIADELNMPWSTAKDRIKKVQKLAQEFYGDKE